MYSYGASVTAGMKYYREKNHNFIFACVWMLNRVWLFATSWMVTHQALLSTEFSKQDYWSGLPFPTPGDLPDPGIEPDSPTSPALTDRIFITVRPWGILIYAIQYYLIHLSLINTCKILMYVTVPLQSFHDIFFYLYDSDSLSTSHKCQVLWSPNLFHMSSNVKSSFPPHEV